MLKMNLKNRFRLIIISLIVLLISIASTTTVGFYHTKAHVQEAIFIDDLIVKLYTLRVLNSEYSAAPSDRARQQWLTNYSQIKSGIIAGKFVIPNDVNDALEELQKIFSRLNSFQEVPEQSNLSQRRLRNQVITALNLESQRIIDWASDVSRRSKDSIATELFSVAVVMLLLMFIVATVTIITIYVTARHILSSFLSLMKGAEEIACGKLGFQVRIAGNDEISTLSNSINMMSNNLMDSYNQLHDRTRQLETEMAVKQAINEQLQAKTEELVKEIELRQVTQQKLEEQAKTLEGEITERIKMQDEHTQLGEQLRQSQKMEAIGLLAAGVAHDFNNILSVIMGYGELLSGTVPAGKMHDNVTHILKATERAAQLTSGLLAFSRKQDFRLERTDIKHLLSENSKFLKRIIGEDIELVALFDQTPLYTLIDQPQIQQVFMNIATNARDAMPCGGKLTIGIRSEMLDESSAALKGLASQGNHAVITISDTGSGMDQKTVSRIFEPFYTTKGKNKGTGLGLSIIHGIVTQHNGSINCISKPGVGTIFNIYIPVCEEAKTVAAPAEIIDEPSSPTGTETILLAEDDDMLMEMTTTNLESNGYKVIQAHDGAEAVELFEKHADEIDMVLLDAIMPKMTGKQAWDKINSLRPGVKACFVSGYTKEIISGKVAVDHTVPFLSKPVLPGALMQKIRTILDS